MSAEIKNTSCLKEVAKGSLTAALLSVLFVMIFALVARIFTLSTDIVSPVNLVIKALSVFIAVLVAVKSDSKGFLKGMLIAFGFVAVSSLIFWLLGGQFEFKNLLTDLAVAVVTGIIAGIIAVNRKK